MAASSFILSPGPDRKTILMEKTIVELKKRGFRVGAVKFDGHEFEIDKPGKDIYWMSAAGADSIGPASGERLAMVKKRGMLPTIEETPDLLR